MSTLTGIRLAYGAIVVAGLVYFFGVLIFPTEYGAVDYGLIEWVPVIGLLVLVIVITGLAGLEMIAP